MGIAPLYDSLARDSDGPLTAGQGINYFGLLRIGQPTETTTVRHPVRHPFEKYNQLQAEHLAQLPEAERIGAARLYRIGNAAFAYQHQFNQLTDSPGEPSGAGMPDDLFAWLDQQDRGETQHQEELLATYFAEYLVGLPDDRIRAIERGGGLAEARRSWPFRRYVLEREDFGMDVFMRLNLSHDDYATWLSTRQK
jgi:hypothetical protein